MPLQIYETLSVAPHLPHFIEEIAQRHIGFHLRDTFLILTPDDATKRDVERALLAHPKVGGILVGKSVRTLSSLQQDILFSHPHPRAVAGSFLQRQALRRAFEEKGLPPLGGPASERRTLWELNRLEGLGRLTLAPEKGPKWRGIYRAWEQFLETKLGTWSRWRAWDEALAHLEHFSSLKDVREIYLLGFLLPDALLLSLLKCLFEKFPQIRIHLTLLPAAKGLDREGILMRSWEQLNDIAEQTLPLPSPPPLLNFRSAPTAVHEARQILRDWRGRGGSMRILAPPGSETWAYLEKHFPHAEAAKGPGRIEALASAAVLRLLDRLPAEEETGLLEFTEFFKKLAPDLETARTQAARERNAFLLRYLERAFASLREWAQFYAQVPQKMAFRDWVEEFRQEILEAEEAAPEAQHKQSSLRPIDHAGLEPVDTLWIAGLVEGTYPPLPSPFLLAEDFQDTLWVHEKNLALESSLALAKEAAILSFPEFSLSGMMQPPALILSRARQHLITEPVEDLPLWREQDLPFWEENLRRERARLAGPNLDSGDLRPLSLEAYLEEKIRRRHLSASYLDEYAKCPWRFFAKWHLRLEEKVEEELEMQPKERGQFLHRLLERTFRHWQGEFFAKKRHPPAAVIEASLEEEFAHLLSELGEMEAFRPWPPVVLRDHLNRIRRQVEGLLAEEQQTWRDAPEKLYPSHLEWSFGKMGTPPVAFPLRGGGTLPLAGGIDRIDVDAEGRRFLIVDYKSSSAEDLGRAIRERKTFQLYLYLLAARQLLFPKGEPLGALYWDLKKQERNQGLALKEEMIPFLRKKPQSKSFLPEEAFWETFQDLEGRLGEMIQNILAGDYSLKPPDCLGSRCEYSEICRYGEKPRQ